MINTEPQILLEEETKAIVNGSKCYKHELNMILSKES